METVTYITKAKELSERADRAYVKCVKAYQEALQLAQDAGFDLSTYDKDGSRFQNFLISSSRDEIEINNSADLDITYVLIEMRTHVVFCKCIKRDVMWVEKDIEAEKDVKTAKRKERWIRKTVEIVEKRARWTAIKLMKELKALIKTFSESEESDED